MATVKGTEDQALAVVDERQQLLDVVGGWVPPGGYTPERDVDFSEVEGISPDMPVSASLSSMVNAVGRVVRVTIVPNIFAEDRANANPEAAEFIFQDADDGRFYRFVSSNALSFRQGRLFQRLLTAYTGVRVRIIGVDVRGQTNDAYGFAAIGSGE